MKIWGIVRNAAGLILSRYVNGDLKQPNLTEQGNVAVENILTSPGGLVPSTADLDDGLVDPGQTVALGIAENYVYYGVSAQWIRAQALLDSTDGQAALGIGTQGVVARLQGWNGATFDRLGSQGDNADGVAVETLGHLKSAGHSYLFNETSWDRQRGNVEGTALASAVRNGGPFSSADIIAYNARGAIGFLNITAVPSVVTVNARFQWKDPVSGTYIDAPKGVSSGAFTTQTVNTAATGLFLFQIGNVDSNFTANIMPRTFRILVTHSAAGNFTYSVGYSLMC